jgi:16S rRNA (guanine966-N2)-methyltransferase
MSSLRVISGSARGRRLQSVPGDSTRPITDRTKESLFNILGADIYGASLLDLFGGTGAVGIEALSRGAAFVRFIDLNRQAVQTIRANLLLTQLGEKAAVLRMDAFQYLQQTPDLRFDYVYIAPPQYKDMWVKAMQLLDAHTGWLDPDAWIIVQIHPVEYHPLELLNFSEFDRRKYGSTLLIFYERKDSPAPADD